MIYVAFIDIMEVTDRTIKVFWLENFSDFSKWLSYNEPRELYVSEDREDILKYIDRMVD